MNAVIYARYSSDSQRDESIDGQIRECKEFAERKGYTIIGEYIDRALSARTADRPEFQRMIKDSEKKLFDTVLVWKLDRFSRDRYDSAHYKHVLNKNGVKVVSAMENISDGPEGIILEATLVGMAEYYSAELAVKVKRGLKENAMKCKNNGGTTPYGYYVDKEQHALAIDPERALIVKEIFANYDKGMRIVEILNDLNDRGIVCSYGHKFTHGRINKILHNRKYIGEYRYDDIVIPGGIPAIVEPELFERVQRRLIKNSHTPGRAKAHEEYLLTTKLFCGTCGEMMIGESGKSHSNGEYYHYYKCGGAKRRRCNRRKGIKKDWMEKFAVVITVQKVLNDEVINRIADAVLEQQKKEDPLIPSLKRQYKDCEKRITNMIHAIENGVFTSSTKERLEELEQERERLGAALQRASLEKCNFTKEEIVDWISQFKYGNIDDKQYQKEIIDIFINSIYVYDDKYVFTYNFKDNTDALTLEEVNFAFGSYQKIPMPPNGNDGSCPVIFVCG